MDKCPVATVAARQTGEDIGDLALGPAGQPGAEDRIDVNVARSDGAAQFVRGQRRDHVEVGPG